jgi:putative aldouronate transport system permease protein
VAQSFSSQKYIYAGEVGIIPKGFNVDTYKTVMSDSQFWTGYKNTILYTVVGTAINIFMTMMFAYPLSKKKLIGHKFFTQFAVITMYFSGGLIPNYLLVNSMHMKNSIWAIVIPGAISTFNLMIMKTSFEQMPKELEEAAAVDGLNTYGIFFRIVVPLSSAIIATMVLFYAVGNWNSWFGPMLYLDDKQLQPVTLYLRNLIASASAVTNADAGSDMQQISSNIKSTTMVLTVLPIVCVYPFVQKYFVTGVMLGAVKE